jgi:hypothetical protein
VRATLRARSILVRVRGERRGGRMTVVRTGTLTRDQAHDP